MHTDSDIFSAPKSQDEGATQALAQRLYPDSGSADAYVTKAELTPPMSTFEELKKLLAQANPAPGRAAIDLGLENEAGQALETCIKAFQMAQAEKTRQYLDRASLRSRQDDHCLYYLSGWPAVSEDASAYLTEQSRKATGGIFLRWNGKGIAINPGEHFLDYFHAQGLHIRDIDYVIVTGEQAESYADVKEIYELNYQINKLGNELKIIHYYFNQKAFQDLSRLLKPHFKQERNNLHSMELFIDSPDVERVDVADGIALHYFLAATREAFTSSQDLKEERAARQHACLGIRLELKAEKGTVRIGYVSHSAWNPLLAHHLGSCDLLIAGFGNTGPQDYHKLSYNPDSLGYHGTFTLQEEIAPRLVLCGEFDGREGDIRLEVVQKMRMEARERQMPAILPADTGLCVNLKSLDVRCSISGAWTQAGQIKVVKTSQAFGQLVYLAPAYVY